MPWSPESVASLTLKAVGQLKLRGTRNVCPQDCIYSQRQVSDISSDTTAMINRDKKLQCWRDLLLFPFVSSSLAEMQSVFTVPDPAFLESGRKRITLQHWATAAVPAAGGSHGSHLPSKFQSFF